MKVEASGEVLSFEEVPTVDLNSVGAPLPPEVFQRTVELIHDEQWQDAVFLICDGLKIKPPPRVDSKDAQLPVFQALLRGYLDRGDLLAAAQVLWPRSLFDPRPISCRQIWALFNECPFGLIMGAGSMSKSYTLGVRLLLEWLRDPMWTTVRVTGPSEDHLQSNLFSHLVALHRAAVVPLPGEVGDLFIGVNRRDVATSSIKGVVFPVGARKRGGRLQGTKRKPRPKPHPVFGKMSRLLVFLDEVEEVPGGVWADIDNLLTNFEPEDRHGLRIYGAFNPINPALEVARRAEPAFGWAQVDPDKHYRWASPRGWEVLRLDAERSENVVENKVLFPGLQTREGLEVLARNNGGKNSAAYFTFGRGLYPRAGTISSIFTPHMLDRARGEPLWYSAPDAYAGADLSFSERSSAIFTVVHFGLASGVKKPDGTTHYFVDSTGTRRGRHVACVVSAETLPNTDTVGLASALRQLCYQHSIPPYRLAVDCTGVGKGVPDLLSHEWGPVLAVNYSGACSQTKIMAEDTSTPEQLYPRVDSELWFSARAWMEFGILWIHPEFDTLKVAAQLCSRQYKLVLGRSVVESKREYISRGRGSPDEADSLLLAVHAVRQSSGVVPSMLGIEQSSEVRADSAPEWALDPDGWLGFRRNVRLDATCVHDWI